jgi:DNA-directed RNA polymerase sigma subunit (sigma70/sigma32)
MISDMGEIIKCLSCRTKDAQSVYRQLCKECYTKHHKKGTLDRFPKLPAREGKIRRAAERHGEGLIDDMNTLSKGKATLISVGRKYGVTREAIRQLYPVFFGEPYTNVVKKRKGRK